MDIAIEPQKRDRRRTLLLGLLGVALAVSVTVFSLHTRGTEIRRDELALTPVRQGDVEFEIATYGVLIPVSEKLLTSPGTAVVEEILVRPGDKVESGTLLLRLSSPELVERRSLAHASWEQARLDMKEAELNAQISNMEEAERLNALMTKFSLAEAELNAIRPIAEKGIVSKFELQRVEAKVAASQAQARSQASRKRLMREVNEARAAAKNDAWRRAQDAFAVADAAANALEIRSAVPGMVQDIYVSLGQGIATGEKLALVTGNDGLLARLKVPQSKAGAVHVGTVVSLDVQSRKFAGEISSIDPRVREGAVLVDVVVREQLPAWVRADQSVTGHIKGAIASGVTYIEGRAEIAPFQQREMFVLADNKLVRRTIDFGADSGNFVEIVAGARSGDQIATGLDEAYYQRDFIEIVD